MTGYRASDIVMSLCGRDSGRLFAVLRTEDNYLFLADGKLRKVENPKKKKAKHVCLRARADGAIGERLAAGTSVQNSELRRLLSAYGDAPQTSV